MAIETVQREPTFDWAPVKFLTFPALSTLVLIEVALGGAFFWMVLPTYAALALFGDELSGNDLSRGSRARTALLNGYLYSALPLALLVSLFLVVHASGGAPTWLASNWPARRAR